MYWVSNKIEITFTKTFCIQILIRNSSFGLTFNWTQFTTFTILWSLIQTLSRTQWSGNIEEQYTIGKKGHSAEEEVEEQYHSSLFRNGFDTGSDFSLRELINYRTFMLFLPGGNTSYWFMEYFIRAFHGGTVQWGNGRETHNHIGDSDFDYSSCPKPSFRWLWSTKECLRMVELT